MRQVESSSHRVFISGTPGTVTINQGDTNTDMGFSGIKWFLLQPTHRIANLFGFKFSDNDPASEGVQIRTCGTEYDCIRNEKTYILVHNKILFFGYELDHTLLNPNHIHNYGILFWDNPFGKDRLLVTKISDELDIPLIMKGAKIGFVYLVPTK